MRFPDLQDYLFLKNSPAFLEVYPFRGFSDVGVKKLKML
jgi:hypothetical protein